MEQSNKILAAIENLGDIEYSVVSEVDFVLDKLASALADEFAIKKKRGLFQARSLSEVLAEIAKKYRRRSPDFAESLNQAADLADDVALALKRVYDEDLNEEEQEEIAGLVGELQEAVKAAILFSP